MPDQDPDTGRGGAGEERKGVLLRLPASLLIELRAWASADLRSLNGHIEYVLREALKRRRARGDDRVPR